MLSLAIIFRVKYGSFTWLSKLYVHSFLHLSFSKQVSLFQIPYKNSRVTVRITIFCYLLQ